MSDWILVIVFASMVVWLVLLSHRMGYEKGYAKGFNRGKFAINKFVLKTNHALGERVEEMNSRK